MILSLAFSVRDLPNIAVNGIANQSSYFGQIYSAAKANDGQPDNGWAHLSCSSTNVCSFRSYGFFKRELRGIANSPLT